MANFYRALRLALAYRVTLAGAVACALLVAVLWGGNISTLYPVVEVVFKGQSLHDWIGEEIARSQTTAEKQAAAIDDLQARLATAPIGEAGKLRRQIDYHQSRLEAEEAAQRRLAWLEPYVRRFAPNGPFETLVVVIAALIVGTLIKDLFLVLEAILVERLAQLATFDLRRQFYRRTLQLDLARFGEKANSDMIARFTADVSAVTQGIHSFFGRTFSEPLKMIVCLIGAALICWRLLLLSLIVVPVCLWLINKLARSIRRASRKALEEFSALYHLLAETFAGIKVVKAFTMERYERRRFHHGAKQLLRKAMKIARYDALVRPLTELMGILVISLAILAGAYLVLNQETHLLGIRISDRPLTLGSLLVFYGLLAGVSDPARKMADVFGSLQRAIAGADRVYELLDREPNVVDPPRPTALPRHHESLVFDSVDFGYVPSQPVLRDVSLTIPFGETLAIVGANGCGKSTLLNLIPRFFDPQQGAVRLDGVDLREVRRRDLCRQIGLVTQETLLFNDTVYNNIRYGKLDATRDEIRAAAEQAHAHKFIVEQLEHGYDTLCGPGGNRLSGGQRQRIALARAILRDPAILLLDEATSQIDLESEQLIHRVLASFVRNRTTIIITHRLSVLDLADRILVMDQGRVVDIGPHAELMGRCELYRRLYRLDFRESA